ncbi:Cell division cycle protein [Spathaspora sp. JA1]|nr:Cell division cycle protein [Spathaspora sp. JA1]
MTKSYSTFEKIELTPEEVIQCSYSNWSKYFPQNIFPSKVIKPVPSSFLEYLASESIKLPGREAEVQINSDNEYSDWEEDEQIQEVEGEEESKQEEEVEKVSDSSLVDFQDEIFTYMNELGGHITPKLNWSSPKDAKWILAGNTTKCSCIDDIFLLLKSSDHIVDDLDFPFSAVENNTSLPIEYELVLKQWQDINPALEFRVFIKDEKILGISQRDLNHYEYLQELQPNLNQKISEFIYDKIIPTIGSHTTLEKYIVDVYIPRPFNKIYIIDINPFSRKTDSLLFAWNELLILDTSTIHDDAYEFRIINETNLGAFAKKEFSESQVPIDVIGASYDTEAMIQLARQWNELQLREQDKKE